MAEERGEAKVMWITCPECGVKLGIIISVGRVQPPEAPALTPDEVRERLSSAGIDPSIVDIRLQEGVIVVTPKRFLGELWGPVNDVMREVGGVWVREGKESRWEIRA